MKITIKTRYIVIGAILSLFLTLSLGWYLGYAKHKKASEIALSNMNNAIQRLTLEINDKDYYLTKTEQELKTERELRKQDIVDKETLKALNIKHVKEISRLELRIDTLLTEIQHNGEIVIINTSAPAIAIKDTTKAIRLPFSFKKQDEWLRLIGNFDNQGVLDVSLRVDIPVDIYSAIDKKTKKNTVYITTPNKYVETISVRSYKTDVPKPKRWGIGFSFGYAVSKNITLSPFIGIGLNYNIIRF